MHGGCPRVEGQRELRPFTLGMASTKVGDGAPMSEKGMSQEAHVRHSNDGGDDDRGVPPPVEPIAFTLASHSQSSRYLPSVRRECRSANSNPASDGRRSGCANEDGVFHVFYGTAGSSGRRPGRASQVVLEDGSNARRDRRSIALSVCTGYEARGRRSIVRADSDSR